MGQANGAMSSGSSPPELCSFIEGLDRDTKAMVAALALPWSDGPVEGEVNRLKVIKRQTFTQEGVASLPRRKASGRKRLCAGPPQAVLVELLRRPPSDFGIESATWTGADLAAVARQQGIAPTLSARTARREIQRAGYRWQQAKRWSAKEPEYERKQAAGAPGRAGASRSRLGAGG